MAITLAGGPGKRGYVSGYTLARLPDRGVKPKVFKVGRVCKLCGSPLAKYNKGPNCYLHSKMKYRTARGQRSDARST